MRGEVHLFAVWERGRTAEPRILADIEARFRVLDVVDVTWSPPAFRRNLIRFYGNDLPPDSDKERACGTGPFVVVTVLDERPRHRLRRAGRRLQRVNAAVVDAKSRYRDWAGGEYRVHASDHAVEAERDLVLLFGRRAPSFLPPPVAAVRRAHVADTIGLDGWRSVDELLLALEVTAGGRSVPSADGADLAIAVRDLWWAEHIAGGEVVEGGSRTVLVAGEPIRLDLVGHRRRPGG